MKKKNEMILKLFFLILSVLFVIPSVIYLLRYKTVFGFCTYYNFFINDGAHKVLSSVLYLFIFICMSILYILLVKNESIFKNIKQLLIYIAIVSVIFILMLPWTSSDIFYYMGVGELDSVYNQNPYYVTMENFYGNSKEKIDDEILIQGANNFWSNTIVVYGPVAQFIFKILTKISFKNINLCLIMFKIANVLIHILNCYLIFKITKKMKFTLIYGLNPFIFIEFIGNVHNDIIVVFFILLSLHYLIDKKRILPSLVFLSVATGIKYFTILLLPLVILYYIKDVKKIGKRIVKCIEYGIIFLVLYLLQYVMYYKDMTVLISMGDQTQRYCKSIYSGLFSVAFINDKIKMLLDWNKLRVEAHKIVFCIFVYLYIVFCLKLLIKEKIDWNIEIKKYNFILIVFLLSLSNFQQWYLIWLFGTLMWQDKKMLKSIVCISLISEIANSVYMFKIESWRYDYIFVMIIWGMFLIWTILEKNSSLFKGKDLDYEKSKYNCAGL